MKRRRREGIREVGNDHMLTSRTPKTFDTGGKEARFLWRIAGDVIAYLYLAAPSDW
jgi:hypothetical protein